MPVQAVLFDIGGVLEVTPRTDWRDGWAARFGLTPAAFEERVGAIFEPGATGGASVEEIERRTAEDLGLGEAELAALMGDAWAEYLGTLNHELAGYFGGLRPRYRTGILSNSFVGAREREQALYGFEDMWTTSRRTSTARVRWPCTASCSRTPRRPSPTSRRISRAAHGDVAVGAGLPRQTGMKPPVGGPGRRTPTMMRRGRQPGGGECSSGGVLDVRVPGSARGWRPPSRR